MKCKYCGKEVANNTVFCPFCHENTFSANKSITQKVNNSCTAKNKRFKQRVILISVTCIALIFVIILFYNICFVKSKPPGMNEQTYKAGCKIVELTDKYLDFELSKSEAYTQISEINDRIYSDNKSSSLGVSIYSNSIAFNLSSPYPDNDEVLNDRNSLAKELGLSKK